MVPAKRTIRRTNKLISMKKEQIIEKIKKLQKLAESGVDGEKENAARRVQEIMEKYSITDADIEEEKEETFTYFIEGSYCWELLRQIAFLERRDFRIIYIPEHRLDRIVKAGLKLIAKGKKHNVAMMCTPAEFIEITSKYEILHRGFKEQEKAFFYAFLDANNLLAPRDKCEKNPEPTEQEKEMYHRAAILSLGVDKVDIFPQITK